MVPVLSKTTALIFDNDSITFAFFKYILFFPKMRSILPYVNVAENSREQGQATINTEETAGNIFAGFSIHQKIKVTIATVNNANVKYLLQGCMKDFSSFFLF